MCQKNNETKGMHQFETAAKNKINEPHRDKTNEIACAPSEDSDQPGHPPSLISLRCALNG